jgi:hypothetical protein
MIDRSLMPNYTLFPRRPGGEGRVKEADEPVCTAAHLAFPRLRRGNLPLPPKGRRGAFLAAGVR